jgi:hypothetical protein
MEQALGSRAPELGEPLQVLARFGLLRDQLRTADELIQWMDTLPWQTHRDLAEWHSLRARLLEQEKKKFEAERE